MKELSLTPKQGRFIEEYLVDFNAVAAARRAGYSVRTARSQGHELLTKPDIQGALADRRTEFAAKHGVTVERIITELARIAFADVADIVDDGGFRMKPVHEIPRDARAAISGIDVDPIKRSVKFRLHDRIKACELLGRYAGAWDKDQADLDVIHCKEVILVDRREQDLTREIVTEHAPEALTRPVQTMHLLRDERSGNVQALVDERQKNNSHG